jgi:hypothetical protein
LTLFLLDPIDVSELSFDPQNEGEESTYSLTFIPTFTLYSTSTIVIQFPSQYDKSIGRSIECEATGGLIGTIQCQVIDRGVFITNFETYLPTSTNPIKILIYGVINPNSDGSSKTNNFKLGITSSSSLYNMLGYNSEAGQLQTLSAPGWSALHNVSAGNLYCRKTSSYQFYFHLTKKLPKTASKGSLFLDFPSEFSLTNGETSCSTPSTSFAGLLLCSVYRNRITISGHTNDFSGEITILLKNLDNPVDSGKCENLNIRSYDGLNKKIVERSFENLDPATFDYVYPGPLIIANEQNDIYVERGTQTPDIYMRMDYPCRLNLTIKPVTEGFSVLPFANEFGVGRIMIKFRISVSMNFFDGTYSLKWMTFNDIQGGYYTPIKTTKVIITKNKSKPKKWIIMY